MKTVDQRFRWRLAAGQVLIPVLMLVCTRSVKADDSQSNLETKAIDKPVIETVMNQPSYVLSNDSVQAAVTVRGGHLGPLTFRLNGRQIMPFSVSPWWNEKVPDDIPAVARILRGDIFCLPFGLNLEPFHGESHAVHGETANEPWQFVESKKDSSETSLHLSMQTHVRPGRVDKWVTLLPGHTVVYQRHVISGMTGPMCFGHHAMLICPDRPGAAYYSCSRWTYGQVAPRPVELPEKQGYSLLKPGAVFSDLTRVPTITGELADLTRYPARRGFEDVAALAADPTLDVAWNAVAFPEEGYVWFALRNPKVLASTMLWFSNGGRWYVPWNGRHVNVLGVEDNTAFYHYGLAEAAGDNVHRARGIPTSFELDPARPLTVNYIMGLAPISKSFQRLDKIECAKDGLTLTGSNGESVRVAVKIEFLKASNIMNGIPRPAAAGGRAAPDGMK